MSGVMHTWKTHPYEPGGTTKIVKVYHGIRLHSQSSNSRPVVNVTP